MSFFKELTSSVYGKVEITSLNKDLIVSLNVVYNSVNNYIIWLPSSNVFIYY